MNRKKTFFIVGLDDFNLEKLNRLPEAEEYNFLPALKFSEIRGIEEISIPGMLNLIDERIKEAGRIDAIGTYYDFPGSVLVPVIARKYNLPAPSLESILKCEHKYWSRFEQQKVIPENIPQFKAFDPFCDDAFEKINFIPPYWIKPIKSFHSFLAYRVNDPIQFNECIEEVRQNINFMNEPLNYILAEYGLPREISEMKETMIAETMITGHQCTVEGYAFADEVVVYGIVDSIREDDRSSFSRYEYPSSLPQEIQFRMADLSRRVILQTGLMNSGFNIEFFYNETANAIYLLEINPRISQAHTDIFEKIHGVSHHRIMVNMAVNQMPKPFANKGEFNIAAHFMLRAFHSGTIKKVPSEKEIDYLVKKYPDLAIKINVREGLNLNDMDMHQQDSYSFVLANIILGAETRRELLEKYNDVTEHLTFTIDYEE